MATENKPQDLHDEKIMDHDYDGIKELDNPPPRWIMALFYITIGFSIIIWSILFLVKTRRSSGCRICPENRKNMTKNIRLQMFLLKIWYC